MKTLKFLLAIVLITGLNFTFAQTARLQVIHNAADPGAVAVDIYLNGSLLLDNFGFREATPYIDAPAGHTYKYWRCWSQQHIGCGYN